MDPEDRRNMREAPARRGAKGYRTVDEHGREIIVTGVAHDPKTGAVIPGDPIVAKLVAAGSPPPQREPNIGPRTVGGVPDFSKVQRVAERRYAIAIEVTHAEDVDTVEGAEQMVAPVCGCDTCLIREALAGAFDELARQGFPVPGYEHG